MIGIKDLIFLIALGLLLLTFASCDKKSEATISWAFFDLNTTDDLLSISMESCDKWHIVGGKSWQKGVYIKVEDQIDSSYDSLAPKRLNSITFDLDHNLYTVGYTGFSLTKKISKDWHSQKIFDNLNVIRDIDMINDSTGIAVTGISYDKGSIYWLGKNQKILQHDTIPQALRAVKMLTPTTGIAAGYGAILKLTRGKKWERLPYFGDHFIDVAFPSSSVGYIIGNAGSILKTTDSGNTWTFLIKKNTFNTHTAFRAVRFLDVDNGYIAGENGLLWRTIDGGDNWIKGTGLPDIDFYDLDVCTEIGVMVGKGGKMITFDPNF